MDPLKVKSNVGTECGGTALKPEPLPTCVACDWEVCNICAALCKSKALPNCGCDAAKQYCLECLHNPKHQLMGFSN